MFKHLEGHKQIKKDLNMKQHCGDRKYGCFFVNIWDLRIAAIHIANLIAGARIRTADSLIIRGPALLTKLLPPRGKPCLHFESHFRQDDVNREKGGKEWINKCFVAFSDTQVDLDESWKNDNEVKTKADMEMFFMDY